MAWYGDGTIAVTNGSAVVAGAGTTFVENVKAGDALRGPDERLYQIATINSATSLTLTRNYAGATAGGQSYEIIPLQDAMAVLARNVAELIEDYQDIADNAGQGMFGDGAVGTPGLRFANDQDTGLWRPSANVIAWATGGTERMRIGANGNLGIGHDAPNEKLSVALNTGTAGLESTFSVTNFVDSNLFIRVSGTAASDKRVQIGPTTATALTFATQDVERARLDPSGNLLVNATSPFYSGHVINKSTAAGNAILSFASATTGMKSAVFLAVSAEGWNGADAALWLGKQANNRSLNAPGTLNAGGADYAEYMVKAAGCGIISPGEVCGVDADGKLTKSWAAAFSFVIKSTDPSLVGGDTWARALDPRPEPPPALGPAPIAPVEPEPFTDPEPTPGEGESEGAFAVRLYIWEQASEAAAAAQDAYDDAVDAFPAVLAAWESAAESFEADQAQYEADIAAWQADLEAARSTVDRIAFSGQVPANVTGPFAVGDYVLAVEGDGDTIAAIAVPAGDITFDQYRDRIGKVWAIREGRAWIDVQHG